MVNDATRGGRRYRLWSEGAGHRLWSGNSRSGGLAGEQQELAGGAAGRQVLVRAGRVGQGVLAADAHVQFAAGDPREQVARAPEQFGAVGDVVREGGPGEVE